MAGYIQAEIWRKKSDGDELIGVKIAVGGQVFDPYGRCDNEGRVTIYMKEDDLEIFLPHEQAREMGQRLIRAADSWSAHAKQVKEQDF